MNAPTSNVVTLKTGPRAGGEPSPTPSVFFHRRELDRILDVYSRMVARGEWRDYRLEVGAQSIAFAIYKNAAEMPIFRIEKRPKARKTGPWFATSPTGVLRSGRDLKHVLDVFKSARLNSVD